MAPAQVLDTLLDRPRPTHYALGAHEDPPGERRRLWEVCRTLAAA